MTKRLEELFEFDKLEEPAQPETTTTTVEETRNAMVAIDASLDNSDAA